MSEVYQLSEEIRTTAERTLGWSRQRRWQTRDFCRRTNGRPQQQSHTPMELGGNKDARCTWNSCTQATANKSDCSAQAIESGAGVSGVNGSADFIPKQDKTLQERTPRPPVMPHGRQPLNWSARTLSSINDGCTALKP